MDHLKSISPFRTGEQTSVILTNNPANVWVRYGARSPKESQMDWSSITGERPSSVIAKDANKVKKWTLLKSLGDYCCQHYPQCSVQATFVLWFVKTSLVGHSQATCLCQTPLGTLIRREHIFMNIKTQIYLGLTTGGSFMWWWKLTMIMQ